jgi:hypothetical protein
MDGMTTVRSEMDAKLASVETTGERGGGGHGGSGFGGKMAGLLTFKDMMQVIREVNGVDMSGDGVLMGGLVQRVAGAEQRVASLEADAGKVTGVLHGAPANLGNTRCR